MKKLPHIVRFRISEEQKKLLEGKNLSKYIREALNEKINNDFPESTKLPF